MIKFRKFEIVLHIVERKIPGGKNRLQLFQFFKKKMWKTSDFCFINYNLYKSRTGGPYIIGR